MAAAEAQFNTGVGGDASKAIALLQRVMRRHNTVYIDLEGMVRLRTGHSTAVDKTFAAEKERHAPSQSSTRSAKRKRIYGAPESTPRDCQLHFTRTHSTGQTKRILFGKDKGEVILTFKHGESLGTHVNLLPWRRALFSPRSENDGRGQETTTTLS